MVLSDIFPSEPRFMKIEPRIQKLWFETPLIWMFICDMDPGMWYKVTVTI